MSVSTINQLSYRYSKSEKQMNVRPALLRRHFRTHVIAGGTSEIVLGRTCYKIGPELRKRASNIGVLRRRILALPHTTQLQQQASAENVMKPALSSNHPHQHSNSVRVQYGSR